MTTTESRETQALREKIRILERHVDHLMGQLYHQVGLLRNSRDAVAHLEEQLGRLREVPAQLDEALKTISNLREELAGRTEVEYDLRQRLADLEREEETKSEHIERLEGYLRDIWYSPHRRLLRSMKNGLRALAGRKSAPGDAGSGDGQLR